MSNSIINRDPEVLSGTPVFVGTRVPVRILFEYLEAGDSLDTFLDSYPGVTKRQATQLLELAKRQLLGPDEAAA